MRPRKANARVQVNGQRVWVKPARCPRPAQYGGSSLVSSGSPVKTSGRVHSAPGLKSSAVDHMEQPSPKGERSAAGIGNAGSAIDPRVGSHRNDGGVVLASDKGVKAARKQGSSGICASRRGPAVLICSGAAREKWLNSVAARQIDPRCRNIVVLVWGASHQPSKVRHDGGAASLPTKAAASDTGARNCEARGSELRREQRTWISAKQPQRARRGAVRACKEPTL